MHWHSNLNDIYRKCKRNNYVRIKKKKKKIVQTDYK